MWRKKTAVALFVVTVAYLITPSASQLLQFTQSLTRASVEETVAERYPRPTEGFVVVMCIDSAGLPTNDVTYSIESNPGPFHLNATTGSLSVTADLDYETATSYSFAVICTNTSDPNITGMGMVQVDILPVNEFAPVLSRNSLQGTLFENAMVGTTIASTEPGGLLRYTVTDGDDGPDGNITFTLSEGSQDNTENARFFDLDFVTGSLVLKQRLDVDNIPNAFDRVALRITACDAYPPREQCPNLLVGLIVFSANDNSPQFSAGAYEVSYPESIPVGTLIITAICTDNDRGAGEFSGIEIYQPTSELWQLPNSQNGTVFLNMSLDYETVQMHEFTLRCFDIDGKEDFATVTINVLAINDNKPQFNQSEYEFVMSCTTSTAVVGRVEAVDPDLGSGGTITYSMEENDNFAIDANEGTIFLHCYVLPCEGSYFFNVTVLASDGVFSDTTQVIVTVAGPLVNINVLPVNDVRPKFTKTSYTFIVNRISSPSVEIGRVTAVDHDCNNGSVITYSMEENENFRISSNDGRVFLVDFILVLEGSSFNLTVVADDGDFNATSLVYITVTGFLSIPEIILLALAGLILLVSVLVTACCVLYCFKQRTRKHTTHRPESEAPCIVYQLSATDGNKNNYEELQDFKVSNFLTHTGNTPASETQEYERLDRLQSSAEVHANASNTKAYRVTEGETTTASPGIPTHRQTHPQIVDSENTSEDEISHDSKTITTL